MNNFEQLIASSRPTLVDFFATWCGPCKMMHPILEEIKQSVGDAATVIKIDVDQNQQLAMQYGVQAVPTLIIFKQGQPVWMATGVQTAATVTEQLRKFA